VKCQLKTQKCLHAAEGKVMTSELWLFYEITLPLTQWG